MRVGGGAGGAGGGERSLPLFFMHRLSVGTRSMLRMVMGFLVGFLGGVCGVGVWVVGGLLLGGVEVVLVWSEILALVG